MVNQAVVMVDKQFLSQLYVQKHTPLVIILNTHSENHIQSGGRRLHLIRTVPGVALHIGSIINREVRIRAYFFNIFKYICLK
jgi:hypothetical protein